MFMWANANEGFNYTGVQAAADDYPTSPSPNGKVGNCVKLTTKSTGELGERLKMYIAAGNLFTGSFLKVVKDRLPILIIYRCYFFKMKTGRYTGKHGTHLILLCPLLVF